MTESQILEILQRFVGSEIELSVWTYLLTGLVALVSSILGVFVATYAKAKALTSTLDETLRQVKAQEEVVGDIKADIEKELWVDQQRWEFRKDLFLEMIELLYKVRHQCLLAENYLDQIPSQQSVEDDEDRENAVDHLMAEAEKIFNGSVRELTEELKILVNLKGVLFLSDNVMNVLSQFFKAEEIRVKKVYSDAARNASIYDSDPDSYEAYLYHKSHAAELAYRALVRSARLDLRINS
jgi:hypothetical protein